MKAKNQIRVIVFLSIILMFNFTEILNAYEMISSTFTDLWQNAGLLKDNVIYAVNFHNVTQTPYNAIKNDQGDDYIAIKAAIDAAKATPGPDIIYFPAGTYYIGSTIELIRNSSIDYSGIIFQGDGPYSIIIFVSLQSISDT
jgi:hypothetical protein